MLFEHDASNLQRNNNILLIDFNGVAINALAINPKDLPDKILTKEIGKHLVLNMILNVKKQFRSHKVVICCDSHSWRKSVYPYYKFKRKDILNNLKVDWKLIHEIIGEMYTDIKDYFPWMQIKIEGCEADDIIGTIARYYRDIGEEIIIISKDKDFQQLQTYGCKQYNYATRKWLHCEDPEQFLADQIMAGDQADGVPNILSADNCLADGIRQTTLRKAKYDYYKELSLDTSTIYHKYWNRNKLMIDLSQTPKDLRLQIVDEFNLQYNNPKKSRVFDYMYQNSMINLIEFSGDF